MSGFTFVRNAVLLDFPLEASIRSRACGAACNGCSALSTSTIASASLNRSVIVVEMLALDSGV